ncbi:MAG: hypothetical protein ACRC4T_25075 [Cetobacterium sp.]
MVVESTEKQEFEKIKVNMAGLDNRVNERYVTLFFSFDIVNSTQYKTIALKDSLKIIKKIFDEVEKLVVDNIEGIKYWRTIGDEIIFYLEIYKKNEILDSVEYIFAILNKVRKKILNGEIKIDEIQNKSQYRYPELISIKASAWLALVAEDGEKSLNIKYKTGYMTNDKRLEFQGHDIDIGFRVSEYTRNRRFALNFELAYLLSKYEVCKDNLKFIGYKKMKGVWNQRKYPIIWYHNKKLKMLKGEEGLSPDSFMIDGFEESFFYDEEDFCELTKEFNELNSNLEPKNYINEKKEDISKLLERICRNVNLINKLKEIESEIDNKDPANRSIVSGVVNEIHITVICKQLDNVILLKRSEEEKYDFGYIKVEIEKIGISDLKNYIETSYLEEFGLEVQIDEKIYTTYFVDKGSKRIMGLRFEGELQNQNIEDKNLSHQKYNKIEKINKDNYKNYSYTEEKELVPLIEKILEQKK